MQSKRKYEEDLSDEQEGHKRLKLEEKYESSPFVDGVFWLVKYATTTKSLDNLDFVLDEVGAALTKFIKAMAPIEAKSDAAVAKGWLLGLVQDLEIAQPLSEDMKRVLMPVFTRTDSWTLEHFTGGLKTCVLVGCKPWSLGSLAEMIVSWVIIHGFRCAEQPWLDMMDTLASRTTDDLKRQVATLAAVCHQFNVLTKRAHLDYRHYPGETVRDGIAILLCPSAQHRSKIKRDSFNFDDRWGFMAHNFDGLWEFMAQESKWRQDMNATITKWRDTKVCETAQGVLACVGLNPNLVRIVCEYVVTWQQ